MQHDAAHHADLKGRAATPRDEPWRHDAGAFLSRSLRTEARHPLAARSRSRRFATPAGSASAKSCERAQARSATAHVAADPMAPSDRRSAAPRHTIRIPPAPTCVREGNRAEPRGTDTRPHPRHRSSRPSIREYPAASTDTKGRGTVGAVASPTAADEAWPTDPCAAKATRGDQDEEHRDIPPPPQRCLAPATSAETRRPPLRDPPILDLSTSSVGGTGRRPPSRVVRPSALMQVASLSSRRFGSRPRFT